MKDGSSICKLDVKGPKRTFSYPVFSHYPFIDSSDGIDYVVFDNTIQNAYHALIRRVMQEVPKVERCKCTSKDNIECCPYNHLRHTIKSVFRRMVNVPSSRSYKDLKPVDDAVEYVNEHYSGKKRKLYLRAIAENLEGKPFNGKVKLFVKREVGKLKNPPAPRAIQARSPNWFVQFLRLKNLEHAVYNARGLFNKKSTVKEVAKSDNMHARAKVVEQILQDVPNPYIVLSDGKVFDAHIPVEILELEKSFYQMYVDKFDKTFTNFGELYDKQIYNRGYYKGQDGYMSYKVAGNRMSGDWNTALGNVILQCCFVKSFCDYYKVPNRNWRIYDDGDDCMIVVSAEYKHIFENHYSEYLLHFGQELTVSIVKATSPEVINFCQSIPLFNGRNIILTKDINRVLLKYNKMINFNEIDKTRILKQLKMNALSDLMSYYQVPILSELFRTIYESCDIKLSLKDYDVCEFYYRCSLKEFKQLLSMKDISVLVPDYSYLDSVCKAWKKSLIDILRMASIVMDVAKQMVSALR